MQTARSIDTVNSDRLIGSRPRAEDFGDLYPLYSDERVMATLSADGRSLSREEARQRLRATIEHWDEHGFGLWLFRNRLPSSDLIGYCGISTVVLETQPEVDLLYAVKSDRWGQGYATEMSRAVVSMVFAGLRLTSLVAFTLPTNTGSRRVMEKLGFLYERDISHAGLSHVLYRLTNNV